MNQELVQNGGQLINHKRVVSLYVIGFPLIYINFNFDFLDLHNVFFENYFANELTRSIVFEAI
jgi:hypothetical protein